jgi:PAS domain S-box-containing protein
MLRANESLARLLGSSVDGLVGTAFPRFAAAGHRDAFHLFAVKLRENGAATCEMRVATTTGEHRDVRLDGRAHRDEDSAATQLRVCVVDLTDQKRAEQRVRELTEQSAREVELVRIQKLEAIGLLAGGIAHDFNNLLTGILGNIYQARAHPEESREALEEAAEAARAASGLTSQLLTFAKGGAPVKTATSLADLIEQSARFALRGSNVQLDLRLQDDLWVVEGDHSQLYHVIQNLVINADEAMPTGGRVYIEASNVTLEKDASGTLPSGNYVHLTVRDEGTGIDDADLQHIFDLYFTTKREGSGLGLASAFSVVRNHGGAITAESRLGQGTSMHVYLPAAPDLAPSRRPLEGHVAATPGRGRVLVMDDVASIRRLLERSLSDLGYEVDSVADGQAAIDAYRASQSIGRAYDVVLLDLTVPGAMGGLEALGNLQRLDPAVRALVMSGYCEDPVMAEAAHYGFSGVVQKPFDPAAVAGAIRDAMAASDGVEQTDGGRGSE